MVKIQVRNHGVLDKVDSSGYCRKGTDSGYILKVELTIFIAGLDLGCERNRGVKNESRNFGLSHQ